MWPYLYPILLLVASNVFMTFAWSREPRSGDAIRHRLRLVRASQGWRAELSSRDGSIERALAGAST